MATRPVHACLARARRRRLGLVLLLIGALSSAQAHAAVRVQASGGCLDATALQAALTRVLEQAAGARTSALEVTLEVTAVEETTSVSLRARARNDEAILERDYSFLPSDCPSAAALLGTVLRRFVETLPVERWTLPQAEPPLTVAEPGPALMARGALEGEAWPLGASGQVTLTAVAGGGAHHLVAGGSGRACLPASVAHHRFLASTLSLVAGWHYVTADGRALVELHGGTLLLQGLGPRAERDWLPWVELELAWLWRVGALELGPQAALAPLQHSVGVRNSSARSALPFARLGLAIGVSIF